MPNQSVTAVDRHRLSTNFPAVEASEQYSERTALVDRSAQPASISSASVRREGCWCIHLLPNKILLPSSLQRDLLLQQLIIPLKLDPSELRRSKNLLLRYSLMRLVQSLWCSRFHCYKEHHSPCISCHGVFEYSH